MIVVADDFTGAAEIAAVSFERGSQSAVVRKPFSARKSFCIHVFDTDSRLKSANDAEKTVEELASRICLKDDNFLFKKVDSALRGNVARELSVLAQHSGKRRILLLPANPSGGRKISDRVYSVNDIPITETEFAYDPTHPATSDDPVDLLGPVAGFSVHYCVVDEHLPEKGLILCAASTLAEVEAWSRIAQPTDLLAGGRDFYTAILNKDTSRKDEFYPPANTLIIQGTLSPQREKLKEQLGSKVGCTVELSPFSNTPEELSSAQDSLVTSALSEEVAILSFRRQAVSATAAKNEIEHCIQFLTSDLLDSLAINNQRLHLVIEGGATAALVLDYLDADYLQVIKTWSGGVVTLAPSNNPNLVITTKPGSYAWPDELIRKLSGINTADTGVQ